MRLASVASAGLALGYSVLGYQVQTPPLDTDWTYKVGTNPWPEHPRPLLYRDKWQNLNGVWKWRSAGAGEQAAPPAPGSLTSDVLVPSCIESGLSGLQVLNTTYSWFETQFTVPLSWAKSNSSRILLNFEAVDYEATVFVNGQEAGFHRGGYWHFTLDVTQFVKFNGTNTLYDESFPCKIEKSWCRYANSAQLYSQVFVFDPTDMDPYNIPVGKQTRMPSHIFYRSCSGIWQTVWMEYVPPNYITSLDVTAGMDGGVNMTVWTSSGSIESVTVSVIDPNGDVVATTDGVTNSAFDFVVKSPHLWTPNTPTLYNLTVTLGADKVKSYTAFRTISVGEVGGVQRPLLNGEFIFLLGTLDQGFWPDGLYTPPNREAMLFDLQTLKDLGMNMLRKHIKVEPSLFYRACDEMGLLLFQDMPSLRAGPAPPPNAAQQAEFERQLDILIQQHRNYPSIYSWVIYNEGWGQITEGDHPEFRLTERVKELDPTRLVDAVSGWNDHGAGDYHDNHHYANPQCGAPFYSLANTPFDPKRVSIQGEFGGIGHNVSAEHLWKVQGAIDGINQTYEVNADLDAYNYRGHVLFKELLDQVRMYACSGAIYTQTTDVEGEVNGFLTYDRRVLRPDVDQWSADFQALFDAAALRSNATVVSSRSPADLLP